MTSSDEIDLVEREQEEAINETPVTDEIDLIERVQEEVINKTPTTGCLVNDLFLFSFY
jgi:hypothetical protein